MNIIRLLRSRSSVLERKSASKVNPIRDKNTNNSEMNPLTYLNISAVSLEDGQTQQQEDELLSESALHDAHLCAKGAPERRRV